MKLRISTLQTSNDDSDLGNGSLHLVGHRIYVFNSRGIPSTFSLKTEEWNDLPAPDTFLIGSDHAGHLVGDKIYISGGEGGSCMVEFDVILGAFSRVKAYGDTPGPTDIKSMSAVYADWRRELVYFGGHTAPPELDVEIEEVLVLSNDTYGFHVDSKSWELLQLKGEPPLPRTGHSAAMKGFNMYVYGGYNRKETYLTEVWIAHLNTGTRPYWTMPRTQGRLPPGRIRATLNRLAGYLLLFGGYSRSEEVQTRLDLYCPRTRQWMTGVSPEQAVVIPRDSIEVIGGCKRYLGFPLGIEVPDGVAIFTYGDIYRASMVYE